ncbi:hypothetical protein [Actinotalea sp. C106]|uniref:hypothetical protein n=1 Tax=Actinotalea sp. C106 TaxID=2908644 RepID=UPI002028AAFA|nr:hypothetical protein [Actinotalea sp. C106]
MSQPFLLADSDYLQCPLCADSYVHIEDVYVAGRPREDGPVVPVHVDSAGRVLTGDEVDLPIPETGRRHVISLGGRCEGCGGRFTIEFKQHKGQTVLAVRRPVWTTIARPLAD